MHFLSLIDWSKVAELSFAAILSLAVGSVLQWWLLRDQKRFQKQMLDRQLEFMERLERERSERDAKADAERIAAERAIVGHLASTLRTNSLNERNHAARLQSQALSEARSRSMQS